MLESREQRLRAVAERAPDLLLIFDAHHAVRWANEAVEGVFAAAPHPLLGTDLLTLVHREDRAAALATLERLSRSAGAQEVVAVRLRTADGVWRRFHVAATNLLGDPAIGGYLGSLHDISECEQVEGALAASEERYPARSIARSSRPSTARPPRRRSRRRSSAWAGRSAWR